MTTPSNFRIHASVMRGTREEIIDAAIAECYGAFDRAFAAAYVQLTGPGARFEWDTFADLRMRFEQVITKVTVGQIFAAGLQDAVAEADNDDNATMGTGVVAVGGANLMMEDERISRSVLNALMDFKLNHLRVLPLHARTTSFVYAAKTPSNTSQPFELQEMVSGRDDVLLFSDTQCGQVALGIADIVRRARSNLELQKRVAGSELSPHADGRATMDAKCVQLLRAQVRQEVEHRLGVVNSALKTKCKALSRDLAARAAQLSTAKEEGDAQGKEMVELKKANMQLEYRLTAMETKVTALQKSLKEARENEATALRDLLNLPSTPAAVTVTVGEFASGMVQDWLSCAIEAIVEQANAHKQNTPRRPRMSDQRQDISSNPRRRHVLKRL